MKVESKFDIGQKVWAIIEGVALEKTVTTVNIKIEKDGVEIRYVLHDREDGYWFGVKVLDERYVFSSKQELIDSL